MMREKRWLMSAWVKGGPLEKGYWGSLAGTLVFGWAQPAAGRRCR